LPTLDGKGDGMPMKATGATATMPLAHTGEHAAIRRFSSEAKLIKELMIRSESFRGLCEDLAEAERALVETQKMPEALRHDRRAECEGWIESLTNEIEETLREAKVITLAKAKHRRLR